MKASKSNYNRFKTGFQEPICQKEQYSYPYTHLCVRHPRSNLLLTIP